MGGKRQSVMFSKVVNIDQRQEGCGEASSIQKMLLEFDLISRFNVKTVLWFYLINII